MLIEALRQPLFKRGTAITSGDTFSTQLLSWLGFNTNGNINVTQNNALTLSAFYNGITIICNDYAKLPKGVFQKTQDGQGRNPLPRHPLNYLINKKPNQYMTAYQYDSIMLQTAILKGNSYAEIERDNFTSQPIALQYIDQDTTQVQVYKYNNQLWYEFDGRVVNGEDMIHVPGFNFNGITGVSVIKHAALSLGVSLNSQQFANEYYDGKGVGTGVLTTTKSMNDDAKTRYSKAISNMFARKSKWVVPVIDEASKFEHIRITPQEAQFLLATEQGINEVARWLNISPQKLKHNKDVNNSISESLERQHVSDSILPWALKFQQEYDVKLLTSKEKTDGVYTKFNTNSLLSADITAQADYWSKLIFSGVYTRNEVRALLDRNPLDGLDEPLTPVNTQVWDQIQENLKNTKNAN